MISLRNRLIWPALMLATGYAAPAYCQPCGLVAMTTAGASNGVAGELGDPGCCVYWDIGRPDLVTPEQAAACNLSPAELFRGLAAPLPSDSVVPDRRIVSGPFSAWPWLCWSGSGELLGVRVSLTDNDAWYRRSVGEWASTPGIVQGFTEAAPIPGQPTIAEWYAGEPITLTLYADFIPGANFRTDLFTAVYGYNPGGASLAVSIAWLGDQWIIDTDCTLGGRIGLTAEPGVFAMADWDRDGAKQIDDIFAFLSDWFRSDARAGLCDGNSGVATTDIFAFLNDWFEGE